VADGVDPGMVEAVRWHIYDALARTSEHSTLPEEEQDRLLAQVCGEACDVLGRWVEGDVWAAMRKSHTGTVADVIPDLKRVQPFLDPLKETLNRIADEDRRRPGVPEIGDTTRYIDRAIAATEYTGHRYRRLSQNQLFDQASRRVEELQKNVCRLAGEYKSDREDQQEHAKRELEEQEEQAKRDLEDQRKRDKRKRWARSVLGTVATTLLSLALSMVVSTTPASVHQDSAQWVHEASNVLLVHHVAQTAQPNVRIAPPHAGPHVG
jgi:hypothetical protein